MILRIIRYLLIAALVLAPLSSIDARFPRGVATTGCSQATTFLARTSGLDATHVNAYTNLICGLVTDGLWTKLDVLHIYATQDSATALLNLVSTSFNGTANGSPTFTADRGFTGVDTSTTVFIDTGFNPTTASLPNYTQNSAHISVWNVTNVSSSGPSFGIKGSTSNVSYIYARFSSDGFAYFRPNTNEATGSQRFINVDASGHYLANRSSSSNLDGYKNGVSGFSSNADTSTALQNLNFYSLGINNVGTPFGVPQQQAGISIGASFNSTDVLNFYNRERTYMTAVGVP